MDFHRYPVDEQTCEIKFESFGYTLKQVRKCIVLPPNSRFLGPGISRELEIVN